MKQISTLLLLFCTSVITAQLANFENIILESESFLNGSDGSGGFSSGDIFLPNDYNDIWGSWSGWAISNTTDVTTPGFMNQYSAIPGGGAESSSNYAVAFLFGETKMHFPGLVSGEYIQSLHITNSTYTYLSMKDGDSVAKKFGGVSGNDPDFFLLTIKAYKNGTLSNDSIEFYLADYRFEDNSEDYIIDEWTELDLSSLEDHDSLSFTLSSSDVGQFGMNTPSYFCIDNVGVVKFVPTNEVQTEQNFDVFPNPTTGFITLKNLQSEEATCSIYNMVGQLLFHRSIANGEKINLQHLPTGSYLVKIEDGKQISSKIITKYAQY